MMARSNDHLRLTEDQAERLVGGRADDLPPGYGRVAAVMAALSVEPDPEERYVPPEVGRLLAAAATDGRTRRREHRIRRPVTVIAVMMFLLGATVGLGAAGALPDDAQRVAEVVLEGVGIEVRPGPDPNG